MEKEVIEKMNPKQFDPSMQELLDLIVELYREEKSIKKVSMEMALPMNTIKKLLITAGELVYPESEIIQKLLDEKKTIEEIQEITGLGKATINIYLPYTKALYNMDQVKRKAQQLVLNRHQNQLIYEFSEEMNEEKLWECICAFEDYTFYTYSGLPFTYKLKVGKKGHYTKELFVDRRSASKSLTWCSIKQAFNEALRCLEEDGKAHEFKRPKDIGDIRGISYIYSLFYKFKLIQVPSFAKERMEK